MKKFFYSVLAAATMLFATTSCSQDNEILGGDTPLGGNTQKVTFKVEMPGEDVASRAIAEGVEVGKANMANKLAWALYESTKTGENPVITGTATKDKASKEFTVEIDMVKGLEYKVLFLAYNDGGTIFDVTAGDDLKSLNYKASVSSNTEAYDAFAACHTHKVNEEAVTTVTLYRPFAQINAATTDADLEKAAKLSATVVESELVIKNVPTQYNVLTGEVSEYKDMTYTKTAILKDYSTQKNEILKDVDGKDYNYLNMVYVLAGNGTQTSSTHEATFNFYRTNDQTPVRVINVPNLPIERNWRTNLIGDLLTQTESFKIVIDEKFGGDHNIHEGEVVEASTTADLQEAIDNAGQGTTVIKFTQDIDGTTGRSANAASITITQKEGVDLVIDGCGFKFDGTFYLQGQSRFTGAEALTFKDIKFEHSGSNLDFISCDNGSDGTIRYAHNVTVDNCSFTGDGTSAIVGMRYRQCYDITVKNTTGKDLHSLMWASGTSGITFDNVTVSVCQEGAASFGTSTDVVVKNSTITLGEDVKYGISVDGNGERSLVVANSTIEATTPVVVRYMTGNFAVKLEGENTLETSGKYHVAFIKGNWGTWEAPTGTWSITGADDLNVFPREVFVTTIDELNAALQLTNPIIKFGANITGDATVTEKKDNNIVIDGCDYKYDGTISWHGNSEDDNAKTVLKNINFETSTESEVFIYAYDTANGDYDRYPDAITIDNCTFTAVAGSKAEKTAVGAKIAAARNQIVLANIVATNMHLLAQFQSNDRSVEVDNVTINDCKNGISLGNTAYITISNSEINSNAYGIRGDGDAERGYLVIKNTTITADVPVIIRKVTTDGYKVALEGNTVLNAEGLYHVVFTEKSDDVAYVAPAKTWSIEGADNYYVYPREIVVSQASELQAALNSGKPVKLINDIIVETDWDSRKLAKATNPVIIDGLNHTIKLKGSIDDKNWNTVFRFEDKAEVRNLTIDITESTGSKQKAISAKSDLIVENCNFYGNNINSRYAVIFGEGQKAGKSDHSVTVVGCEFKDWTRGVTDNQNLTDFKAINIDNNKFVNAPVTVSAYESINFINNVMDKSYANITSYTSAATAKAKASGNTLDIVNADYNVIGNAREQHYFAPTNVEAQEGFTVISE